jgi:hypothetical protein
VPTALDFANYLIHSRLSILAAELIENEMSNASNLRPRLFASQRILFDTDFHG